MNTSKFNGTMLVKLAQTDKAGNTFYYETKISGFKSLSTNLLVGTLVKEIFAIHEARKFAKVGLKSNLPVSLQVTTLEGETILNTAKLDKTFTAKFKLISEKSFAKSLFAAILWLRHKAQVVKVTDILTDAKDIQFIEASQGNNIVWEKEKKIKKDAKIEELVPIEAPIAN